MAYKALYREWRPANFKDIVGQEHVTRTLQNAMNAGRVSHAYLLCGTRGTGKTTTAKVLAKALNCIQSPGAEICGNCYSCNSIARGSSMDVMEIDAASNRGIDEIRELREKANLSPSSGNYRVYIIDEVHMLTNEAFNALLKTLEEPPSHAIFILATTEPYRVPMTILSRCQRFDFKPLKEEEIICRLQEIVRGTGLTVEDEALTAIARAAEGSLRDGVSILDQASSLGEGNITRKEIHNIMGTVDEDLLQNMTNCIMEGNIARAIEIVDELFTKGKDLLIFTRQLGNHLRNILVENLSAGNKQNINHNLLLHVTRLLVRYEQDMRWSSQPRFLLEMFLFEITCGTGDNSVDDLSLRVARMEETLKSLLEKPGEVYETPKTSKNNKEDDFFEQDIDKDYDFEPGETEPDLEKNMEEDEEDIEENIVEESIIEENTEETVDHTVQESIPPAGTGSQEAPVSENRDNGVSLERIKNLWPSIMEGVKKESIATHACLESCWPVAVSGNILTLGYEEGDITKDFMDRAKNKQVLARVLGFYFKGEWSIRCVEGVSPPQEKENVQNAQNAREGFDEAMQLFEAEEVKKKLPE